MRRTVREDEMESWPDLDPAAEAEGRRLLAAAFETGPAGPVVAGSALAGSALAGSALADDELAGAELLRRQVRRRTSRRRRVRTLVPAGAVVALGAAAVLGLTLTATVAGAPSALAAVTAAAAKTSAGSFRITSTVTQVIAAAPGDDGPPVRVTGVFDPGRGLGEEETAPSMLQVRIVGGHIYVKLAGSRFSFASEFLAHGKPWVGSALPPPGPDTSLSLAAAVNGDVPIDPGALLGLLKSVASVRAEGPASGPGWTGTRYAFTERLSDANGPMAVSGTVYVDNQGRVRRLVTNQTRTIWLTSGAKTSATTTFDVTFGGFGVRVSVTAPPASQVYNLGKGYHLAIPAAGNIAVIGPRR
jgi:hypothetical protein